MIIQSQETFVKASTGIENLLLNMNQVLASQIVIRSGQRILAAGCGVGGTAIWLAKNYDVEIVGITPVAGQIIRFVASID